eukprot:1928844-Ditylum_brightwellii.AAC.1
MDMKFQNQNLKLDNLEEKMQAQGAKLDALIAGINAVMTKAVTQEGMDRVSASQNIIAMQLNTLHTQLEQLHYNALDTKMTEIMLTAEKSCCRAKY